MTSVPDPLSPRAICLRGIVYTVAGKTILNDISLDLSEARIGIVGRNGSGKSTLLKIIAGLVAPTAGTVRIGAIEPARDRKAMIETLGILFQNPDHQILFPTVEEELAFGLTQMGRSRAEARALVAQLLTEEGRTHWAKAATNTLSQGQRQYLNLMSILLMQPSVILLDEPFAGLDLPTETRLTRRLAGLSQQVITISHDPDAVAGCDRVLWLEAGQILNDGPAAEVAAAFRAEMIRLGERDADTDIAG